VKHVAIESIPHFTFGKLSDWSDCQVIISCPKIYVQRLNQPPKARTTILATAQLKEFVDDYLRTCQGLHNHRIWLNRYIRKETIHLLWTEHNYGPQSRTDTGCNGKRGITSDRACGISRGCSGSMGLGGLHAVIWLPEHKGGADAIPNPSIENDHSPNCLNW